MSSEKVPLTAPSAFHLVWLYGELVSKGDAIELMLTGRFMLADEARECGLVDLVVDKNELMDVALKSICNLEKYRRCVPRRVR